MRQRAGVMKRGNRGTGEKKTGSKFDCLSGSELVCTRTGTGTVEYADCRAGATGRMMTCSSSMHPLKYPSRGSYLPLRLKRAHLESTRSVWATLSTGSSPPSLNMPVHHRHHQSTMKIASSDLACSTGGSKTWFMIALRAGNRASRMTGAFH
jgi:hypothetical protein